MRFVAKAMAGAKSGQMTKAIVAHTTGNRSRFSQAAARITADAGPLGANTGPSL
jgi:hypothetical protein